MSENSKKPLRRKLAKVNMYESILEYVEGLADPDGYAGLAEEVVAEMSTIIENSISVVMSGGVVQAPTKSAPQVPVAQHAAPAPTSPQKPEKVKHERDEKGHIKPKTDTLAFYTKYGKFGFKKVQGTDVKSGETVTGIAKRLVDPYIEVESEGGGYFELIAETVKRV